MVNQINDPRYQLARAMRARQTGASGGSISLGPTKSEAGIKLGRAASTLSIQNPELRSRIEAIASGNAGAQRSGVVGTLLGNPLTKTVLKPLEALAIPGRATVAGIREAVDAIDGDKNTRASFSDFTKNIKDPTYGVGKAFNVDTGNKWLDRAIGFVGDVATDPLTYVTFGAGKFAGYAGQMDLAAAVLAKTGDTKLANAVQRFGRAAIKDAEILERVGANRHGLYLFGKRLKVGKMGQGIRIPGSGAIGSLGDNVMSKLRVSASRTKAGKWIQKMTMPAEGLAARQALRQGQVGDEASAALISYFTAGPKARMAAGEALQREERLLANFMQKESSLGLDGYRREIYKYLENPELLSGASPEMQRAVNEWNDVFKWYEGQIDELIQSADPTYEFAPIERYFPRIISDEAFEYRANPSNKYSRSINEIYARDPLEGGGNFKSRTLREGDDWFGHKLTKDDIKSTERLNDLAREHLNGADFFKTDIVEVMPQYIKEFAKESGVLTRHKHLADTGFWKRAEEVSVTNEFIDDELVKSIKGNVKSLTDDINSLYKETSKANLVLVNALEDYRSGLSKQLDELTSKSGALGAKEVLVDAEKAIDDVLNGAMTLTADSLQTVADNLGSLKGRFADLFGAEVTRGGRLVIKGTDTEMEDAPNMIGGLVRYLDNLESDVQRLHDDMWALEQDYTGDVLRAKYEQSKAQLGLIEERFKQAKAKVEEVTAFGNQLESAIDSLLSSGDISDVSNAVTNVLAVAGMSVGISDTRVKTLINQSLNGEKSVTQTAVREQAKLPNGVLKNVTQFSGVNTDSIVKMSIKDFYDNLPRMFTGEMSMQEVREMGLWAILHDDVIYNGVTPESLIRMRSELVSALADADEAQHIAQAAIKNETANGRLTLSKVFESQWKPAYMRAKTYDEEATAIRRWLDSGEGAAIASNPEILDMVVTPERLGSWVDREPWIANFIPENDSRSYIEDLMGVNDYTGKITDKVNSVALPGVMDKAYASSALQEEITFGQLLTQTQQRLDTLDNILGGNFFTFGTGVGEKSYTGYEVIMRMNEYKTLRSTLLGRSRERASEYKRLLKELGYDKVDDATSAGRAKRAAIEEEARTRAGQRVEIRVAGQNRISESELRRRLNDISGGDSTINANFISGSATTQEELAEKVINYMMVSDVSSRFNAVAKMMAPFGLVPTEKMFRTITQSVGAKFIPSIDRQITSVYRARDIMTRLDAEIAQAINNGVEGGETPHMIFKRFMKSLSKNEQEVLADAVGTRVLWDGDPYELNRGLRDARAGKGKELVEYNGKKITARTAAENDYLEKFVKPWFQNAYPNITPTKNAMKDALAKNASSRAKTARRALLSPWGESADTMTIKRWFESIIGDSAIPGPSTRTVGYSNVGANMGSASATRIRMVNGSPELAIKLQNLKGMRNRFNAMLAPDSSMDLFIAAPSSLQRTPTFYASLLRDKVDEVERAIAARSSVEEAINVTRGRADEAAQMVETERRQAAGLASGVIPDSLKKDIQKAKDKVDAYEAYTKKIDSVKQEVSALNDEIRALRNKSRTKAGLTKQENSRLKSLLSQKDKKAKDIAGLEAPQKPTAKEVNLASSGSTVRPKRETPLALQKKSPAEQAAEQTIDEYNSLMSSPAYATAKADEQIVRAIESLSGFDMWKFTDGFTVDGEVFATLPGNRRIVFSQEEWESLFTGIRSEQELASRSAVAASAVRQEAAKIRTLRAKRDAAEAAFNAANEAYQRKQVSGSFQNLQIYADRIIVEQAKKAFDDASAELAKQIQVVNDFKRISASLRPDVRSSALEKMRVLVHGSKNTPPVFDEAGLRRFANFEMPFQRSFAGEQGLESRALNVRDYINTVAAVGDSTASSRARALNAAWQASPEFAFLKKMSDVEQKMFVLKYKSFLDNANALESYRNDLLSQIDSLTDDLATADTVIANANSEAMNLVERSGEALRTANTGFVGPMAVVGDASSPEELRMFAGRIEGAAETSMKGKATAPNDSNAMLRNAQMGKTIWSLSGSQKMAETQAAKEALDDWSRIGKGPMREPQTSQEWLALREPGAPGQRQVLLKQATDAWKSRVNRAESTRSVIEALQNAKSNVRAEMVTVSGSVEQFWRELADGRSFAASLQQQIDEVSTVIERMPPKDVFEMLKKASRGKATNEQIQTAMQNYRVWIRESRPLFDKLAKEPDNPVYKAWAAAAIADSKLIDLELTKVDKINELYTASTPVWRTMVIQPLADEYEKAAKEAGIYAGMQSLKSEGLGGLYGNKEAIELLRNIERIREPGVIDDMARFMRGYTGFFKSYATLSPGFHVRNSISNIFSIFSAGAEIKNMREGFRLWRLMDDHFTRGGTLESWVATLPAEQQEVAMKAARIVLGLGGGKTDDALEAFAKEGSEGIVKNNPFIRTSRKAGHKVEGSARFMLAYDSLVKGMEDNVAFNRTHRFLIDYQSKTLLDNVMADIVPFWTWMSRNLPLQIINRWTNPKAYLMYQRLYNNFNEEGEITPGYIANKMGINLGGGNYLTPDLPFSGIDEQIEGFADPQKLMGFVNPGLRVPIEMLANKQFFSGREFQDSYVKLEGKFAALLPVFAAAGQLEYNSQGQPMVRQKAMYAVLNTVPFLGRMDRLIPSDDSSEERNQNAVNSFLGIPFTQVDQKMRDSEQYRRLAQLQALENKRKALE